MFNIEINIDTYDFDKKEFIGNSKIYKNLWKFTFIFFNGFIILCCVYALIFILMPIIYFRIIQRCKKSPRYSEIKNGSNISLLKERFTSDAQ